MLKAENKINYLFPQETFFKGKKRNVYLAFLLYGAF